MGEVYRARDTRLDRLVAIKVASEHFSARFEREAHSVAALNHPNICALYDVGPNYLVMELVEGQSLAVRIAQGAMPVEETLPIARQIAEALEAAHEKGIVHRDLKPSNVMITPDGKVKVLDFGLAKVAGQASANEPADPETVPTITILSDGVVLGTPAYMPPEQARGAEVDKRADIWSFGAVLYEMLAGEPLFHGKTVADTLAAVLRADLDFSRLPANSPTNIRKLLRRCLERDQKQRLRDIGEARIAIDSPETSPAALEGARRGLPWLPWAAATLLGGLAAWGWLHTRPPVPHSVTRWTIPVTNLRPVASWVALSRDGSRLAYVQGSGALTQIALQMMDQFEAKPVQGTEGGLAPSFSPDGQWIVFQVNSKVGKIPATGGTPTILCDGAPMLGTSWGDDNTILLSGGPGGGLSRVSAAGGAPQTLTSPDAKKGERFHLRPQSLPGGQAVLFTIKGERTDQPARVAVLDLNKGGYRVLVDRGSDAHYVPTGHLVYERSGTLFAAPFDLKHLVLTGPEAPVVEGVSTLAGIGLADYAIADSGLLVYRPAGAEVGPLQWIDRKGTAHDAKAPPRNYSAVRLSPDAKYAAVEIPETNSTGSDIWLCDLSRGVLTRLTFNGFNSAPIWSPNGRRVAFAHQEKENSRVYWTASDASGKPEPISGAVGIPTSWTPDGNTLLYTHFAVDKRPQIWRLGMRPGPDSTPRPFLESSFDEHSAQISPDGRWVAYVSNESGRPEVYVRAFSIQGSLAGSKTPISTQGGFEPRWSRAGSEVCYRVLGDVVTVEVQTAPAFRALRSQVLFQSSASNSNSWDVASDGERFLSIKYGEAAGAKLLAVADWFEELRRRVPPGKK